MDKVLYRYRVGLTSDNLRLLCGLCVTVLFKPLFFVPFVEPLGA